MKREEFIDVYIVKTVRGPETKFQDLASERSEDAFCETEPKLAKQVLNICVADMAQTVRGPELLI